MSALAPWRQIAEQCYQLWQLRGVHAAGGGSNERQKACHQLASSTRCVRACLCVCVHYRSCFFSIFTLDYVCVYNYSSLDSFRGLSAASGSCVHTAWQHWQVALPEPTLLRVCVCVCTRAKTFTLWDHLSVRARTFKVTRLSAEPVSLTSHHRPPSPCRPPVIPLVLPRQLWQLNW